MREICAIKSKNYHMIEIKIFLHFFMTTIVTTRLPTFPDIHMNIYALSTQDFCTISIAYFCLAYFNVIHLPKVKMGQKVVPLKL